MFLESIEKRLAALKEKMDTQANASKKAAKKTVKNAVAGAKTIGVQVEPKLYARIREFKEIRGIASMKKAVIALCEEALATLKIY